MKNLLLAASFILATFAVEAQTMYINNHTACPVNVYPFADGKSPCNPATYCGTPTPYSVGVFSVTTVTPTSMGCIGNWAYAVLNTAPNPNGYADGCQVGNVYDSKSGSCNYIFSGSFYVVSCGSFVNVTWTSNTPTPGDVTIDIN